MCHWGWFGWGGFPGSTAVGPWAADGWGWLGVIIPAIFWLGLLALLFWAATRLVGGRRPAAPLSEALTILQARYVRGELTKAQYDEMRRDLT